MQEEDGSRKRRIDIRSQKDGIHPLEFTASWVNKGAPHGSLDVLERALRPWRSAMYILVPWKPVVLVWGLLSGMILVSFIASSLLEEKIPSGDVSAFSRHVRQNRGDSKAVNGAWYSCRRGTESRCRPAVFSRYGFSGESREVRHRGELWRGTGRRLRPQGPEPHERPAPHCHLPPCKPSFSRENNSANQRSSGSVRGATRNGCP